MKPGTRAAARRIIALAALWGFPQGIFAAGDETAASLGVAVRRYEQKGDEASGLASTEAELAVLQGNVRQKSQVQELAFDLGLKAEGGRSATGDVRYLAASLLPRLGFEGARQTHHLSLSLTRSYDSQGLARQSLRDQLDGAALTDDQKNRYTQAGVQTDHYVSLSPRDALVVYLSTDRLDREIVTRTYVAGGFIERDLSPLWKLRLGGGVLRVVYDGEELRASGPEVSSLHQLSEAWRLTLKLGSKDYRAASGSSTAQSGGAALDWKRGDDRGSLGFERQTGQKPVTVEVTTSDLSTAKGRVGLSRETALEANVEQRRERWLEGRDEGARADTLRSGVTLIFGWVGRAKSDEERSHQGVFLSFEREDLRVKSGAAVYRQMGSVGVERTY